jgi:signal transduction histidine kinase
MRRRDLLIVDDDPHILEVLGMRLEAMGFGVTVASRPTEALRLLREMPFDVALVDLRMEPYDGIALLRAAREAQSRLPILIMTAHGTIERAVEAIKEGAFDFLTKPFLPEELRTKIGRALAARRWAHDRVLLRRVGEMLASTGDVERILDIVVRATVEATEAERVALFLRGEREAIVRAVAGESTAPIDFLRATGETVIARGAPTSAEGPHGHLLLAAPLLIDGLAQGALVAENPAYVLATEDDLELLVLFAAQAAAALKSGQEIERLRSGAFAALGRMATQIAHDVNNALGAIKLNAHVLEQRFAKAEDEQGRGLAQKIVRGVDRLAEMAGEITAYGRPAELAREPTRVNALLDECLTQVQDRVVEKQIRVVQQLDTRVGEMSLDGRELHKVFLNLAANAVDAMDAGGTLTVRSRADGSGGVEVVIEDTGHGMDEQTRLRAFEPFFTTKPRGTGLGMAIVRSVIDRHGGTITLESEPGVGTRVTVRVPPEEG